MMCCTICGCAPCVNESFCAASRNQEIGQRQLPPVVPPGWDTIPLDALWARLNQARRTPQSTIEAVIVGVRERGLKALDESANLERLSRCDETACAQINNRIARIIEQKRCPR